VPLPHGVLRQEEKAEAERTRLAEQRHLQQMQFEWHKTQAAAVSTRQQAQFESQLEWQRAQAKVEKATQEEQFNWRRDKDARNRANCESIAAQLKLYGDIVKNVAPKFPFDFAGIPIFYESMQKLFDSVKVPVELRSKLLLPHLSERARSLLLRLDHKRQDDYVEVRTFLLSEFQLAPFQFKSRT